MAWRFGGVGSTIWGLCWQNAKFLRGKNLRLGHLGGINLKLGSMLAKRCLGKGVGGGCVLSLDLYE